MYSALHATIPLTRDPSICYTTSTLAAVNYPALFSSLVLVDPVLRPLRPNVPIFTREAHISRATNAIRRRAHWPSRYVLFIDAILLPRSIDLVVLWGPSEEAKKQFQATPFWQRWHPDALDLYVECGLCEDPYGGVKLKMSGMLVSSDLAYLSLFVQSHVENCPLQEAIVFAEAVRTYEAWQLCHRLDPRIALKFVMSGDMEPQ
jgi:hypothetical protein